MPSARSFNFCLRTMRTQPKIQLYRRYWCWDSVTVPVVKPGDAGFPPQTWDDFFDFRVALGGNEQTLPDRLEGALHKGKVIAIEKISGTTSAAFPEDFVCTLDLQDSPGRSTTITVECRWMRY